ncbi:hypothetical protein HBB16_04230 [Pseudonocardia sp. MCCB 268]|nr:hypothetical protein [Pseudonocardia cytotoxica]
MSVPPTTARRCWSRGHGSWGPAARRGSRWRRARHRAAGRTAPASRAACLKGSPPRRGRAADRAAGCTARRHRPVPGLSAARRPESEERLLAMPLLQELVARGITVLTPNIRGSSGRGRMFATWLDDRHSGRRRDHRRAGGHAAARERPGRRPAADRRRRPVLTAGSSPSLRSPASPDLYAGGRRV